MTTRTLLFATAALIMATGASAQYSTRKDAPKLQPVTLAVTGMT